MSLQLILGSSGSGKSYQVYHQVIEESLQHPESNYIILVPEQFTMETQKDMVTMHPRHGLLNIDILSFVRLAYRVFDELGEYKYDVLDDTGKNLILQKVIEEQKEELKVFKSKAGMQGFTSQVKSALSELFQYGIDEERLGSMIEDTKKKPLLNSKLKDLAILYRAFKAYISENYITSEELLQVLCQVIEKSDMVKKSEFVLEGFTGFTPIQYQLISLLLRFAKKVTVTVTIPKDESNCDKVLEHELFRMSKVMINKLKKIASENSAEVLPDIFAEDYNTEKSGTANVPVRFKEFPAMAHLEKNLFRYGKKTKAKKSERIRIVAAKNPYEEITFVVNEILRLVREEKFRYRDIAIVTGDMERYHRELALLLEENGIPAFLDNKRSILKNPMVEAIRSLIEMAESDFSYESVFRYLRSSMGILKPEETDILENYVLEEGIRGEGLWKKEWTITGRNRTEEQLGQINEYREKFYHSVWQSVKVLKKKGTVEEYTRAIYDHMVSLSMEERLNSYRDQFEEAGNLSLAKEYDQTYQLVLNLFDQIVSLLGQEKISIKEYGTILDSGFEEIKVGVIPLKIDQVLVGDIERTRLNHVKALFFVGVNDGVIPNNNGGGGIFTEADRGFLEDKDYELSPTVRENAFIQKFYLYQNLTKPEYELYLTYSGTDQTGKSIRPSYLISTIKNLYENLEEEFYENVLTPSSVNNEKNALRLAADGVREYAAQRTDEIWQELYHILWEEEKYRSHLQDYVDAAYYQNDSNPIPAAVARQLYGTGRKSVTRLEKYASCAYAHFLEFGLMLAERKEYETSVADLGTMYHNSLEFISEKISSEHMDWKEITPQVREEMVKEAVTAATDEYKDTALMGSARNAYMVKRLMRMTDKTVWALSKHLQAGKFKPARYEMPIENGRVDRVDTYDDGSDIFVKVIDYKSGTKEFSISDTYYGLQMQLVLYMGEVIDKITEETEKKGEDKKVVPGGMFYYHIKDPFVSADVREDEDGKYLKEFMMSGLVNGRKDVIDAFDVAFEAGGDSSNVVNVKYKKDGNFSASSSVAEENEFGLLLSYAKDHAKEMEDEISEGRIAIAPYKNGNKSSCNFCKYKSVCEFDTRLPGNQYRNLPKLKPEDVWEKIREGNMSEENKTDGSAEEESEENSGESSEEILNEIKEEAEMEKGEDHGSEMDGETTGGN